MTPRAKYFLTGAVLLALAAAVILLRPSREPITIHYLGTEHFGDPKIPTYPEDPFIRAVFAVTNMTSERTEIAVGPTPPARDYPRGDWGTLTGHSGRIFKADMSFRPKPWKVMVKSRRSQGRIEAKLRFFGAKLGLCEAAPQFEEVRTFELPQ